jgi:hypothetical protein
MYQTGLLIASNCTFVGNTALADVGGGAVRANGVSAGFYGCTFLGNRAVTAGGGAIRLFAGPLLMYNSTLWGNRSGTTGGAIHYDSANGLMYNCTISSNTAGTFAGGIYANSSSATMSIYNSILGTNTSASGSTILHPGSGTPFSIYRSLIYGTYTGATLYDDCLIGQDPKVLPPADNGGPTWTCAIAADSPARNAGNAATALAFDQRGYACDAQPDMGAFEYVPPPPKGTVILVR